MAFLLWIKNELIYSKARIFQTLHTGIDNRTDNQNLSNENKPEHHDHHDDGTEKNARPLGD